MSALAVIIPALNEAGNIADLIRETQAQDVQWVIVVDNGSTDDTAKLASQTDAVVISEPRRGYGYACQAGSNAAIELQADILIYLDGDYSSLPIEIPQLLAPLKQDQADLVLGSRMLGQIAPGAMPPHQRFGNRLSAFFMSWLYNVRVTDLGPYRAIRTDLLRTLEMREMTFGWPTEMMVKAAKRQARILEVPVSWHRRRSGRSKVSGTIRGSVLATYYILGVTLRYAWK